MTEHTQGVITPALAAENRQVLNLVQALLGFVTPNLRRVSLEMHGPDVHVEFVIEHDDPTTRDDIEEIAFSFDALQTGPHSSHHIVVDARPLQDLEWRGRLVYLRKELVSDEGQYRMK